MAEKKSETLKSGTGSSEVRHEEREDGPASARDVFILVDAEDSKR